MEPSSLDGQNDIPLTLSAMQGQVDDWIKSIGVRYFSELTNLAILMEEVGELSRLMAVRFGEKSPKTKSDIISSDTQKELTLEMGDILFVLTCLANQMGLSLEDCINATLEKNTKRDKNRHISNPKLKL